MDSSLNRSLQIEPPLVFFIIFATQFGLGVLRFPKDIAAVAGYQAWIAVIITWFLYCLVILMIYFILNKEKQDLVAINRATFGKYISAFLSFIFLIYFIFSATIILRGYIRIVQSWIFPELSTWALTLAMLLIIYYAISQGFRVVVGVCFLGSIIPFFLFFFAFSTMEFATYRNLLPFFNTTIKEQMDAVLIMTFSYIGAFPLFLYYPFIQKPMKSLKYALFANSFTAFTYLAVTFFTFIFFSKGQLLTTVYPTLSTWQVLKFPFLERFEYLGIASWMFVIIPNIAVNTWAASRLLKRQLNVQQRFVLPFVILTIFITSLFFETRREIKMLSEFIGYVAIIIDYIFIPILFFIILLKRGGKK